MKLYGVFRVLDGVRPRRDRPGVERDPGVVDIVLITHKGHPLISQTEEGAQKLLDFYEKHRDKRAGPFERAVKVGELYTLTTRDIVPTPPQELVAD